MNLWPWLVGFGNWALKLIGGWLPIGTKPLPEWFGKIAWVVGIILVFNFVSGWIHKPQANTVTSRVIALPFSHIGNVMIDTDQKNEAPRRKWWQPIPYTSVSGFGEAMSGGEVKTGVKGEAGVRLDF
jgi:hypothetical protein